MLRSVFAFSILNFLLVSAFSASSPASLRQEVENYVNTHQNEIVRELVEVLSIPDVAADRENIRKKAELLRSLLQKRGLESKLLETDGNPLVYGELKVPRATRTLLLYCHYDGQPVDPTRWRQDSPWKPILRERRFEDKGKEIEGVLKLDRFEDDWRIYARSSSDDTSPIIAILAALDALRSVGRQPSANLRVILDGEEEAGSPSLVPAIDRYRDLLEADLMFILDGPIHPSNRPTLVFGARGILTLQLTVYGPKFSLHSGHYGNWVPNPAWRLVQLLETMKDEKGKVTIDGFYDGITFSETDRRMMEAVPDSPEDLQELFGIAEPDAVGSSLQEARNFPSLNIRGLKSGWVEDEVRTIIPDSAIAEIDIRLVKETSADAIFEKVLEHIRKQGYTVLSEEPTDQERASRSRIVKVVRGSGSESYRTAGDDPEALKAVEALRRFWGEPPVLIRTSGGTVPISPFIEKLGFPALSLPIVNFDNNQHSPNENLRLGHLFRGIVSIAGLLAADGGARE